MEQFLNPHEYMFQFDIKQGYHHIDIYKSQQKFLGLNHHEKASYSDRVYPSPFNIYKNYEMSSKTLMDKRDQNSLLSS